MAKLQIVRSLNIHKHLLRSSFISFYWSGFIEIKRYRSGAESNNINWIKPNEMKHYNEQKSHCLNFFFSPVVTFIALISLVRWYSIHISSTSLFSSWSPDVFLHAINLCSSLVNATLSFSMCVDALWIYQQHYFSMYWLNFYRVLSLSVSPSLCTKQSLIGFPDSFEFIS